ncbi:MAG: hypothetical protein ACYCXW_10965, partial [Solirubrobacteraceae bacterium]
RAVAGVGVLMATEAQAGTAPPPSSANAVAAERSLAPRLSPTGKFYVGLALGSLALGALSLLFPSTPSYDPWSWLLWAREIVHGHLTITSSGTSWKPLPMIFTIPFALFGSAAANLWLMVARAGALAAVVMVFRLSWKLTRQVGGLFGEASGTAIEIGPPLVAGLIGAAVLLLSASGAFLSSNALGYSEAFAAALLMISIERLIDGRPRQSFIVGFFVALDRPEIWAFWGLLGLWLLWRDPGARVLVVLSAVVVLAAWFVPVKLGCGSFTCSVSRALKPRSNSLAFASSPFEAELSEAAWPTMLLRIKVPAALLVLTVAGLTWREARRRGLAALAAPRNRARIVTALLAIGGLIWFVVIAVMTQIGFSGNNRYLVLGSALVDVCGAVAFGWAARELGVLAMRALRRGSAAAPAAGAGDAVSQPAVSQQAVSQPGSVAAPAGSRPGPVAAPVLQWAAAGLMGLLFLFGPNWVGPNLISFPRTHRALVYQANLRKGLGELVSSYGGPSKVLACGSVMTEGFQVPMVSWVLGVPTTRIEAPPADSAPADAGPAPNVILQTEDTRGSALLPFLSSWPDVHYHYVGTRGPFHMFTHCQG